MWLEWIVASDATRVLLARCGLDPDTTHHALVSAINQWFSGVLHRHNDSYVDDIIYLANMVNSDYVPALDCIREGLLR